MFYCQVITSQLKIGRIIKRLRIQKIRDPIFVKEGKKVRQQLFKGTVIARKGSGMSETITVRKVSNGVGVERIFPLHSPSIASIKVDKVNKVRRAKLYYLRNLSGKAARLAEKK